MNIANTLWDVVVVGGGPAGMMTASRAAELGAKVLLVEKNVGLGKKLLITGGGRCNVTNAEPDLRTLLAKYKSADQFLFSPFSQFDNKKAVDFFESHDVPTKVENDYRVFPQSNKAESIWTVLVERMQSAGVVVQSRAKVAEVVRDDNVVTSIKLESGEEIKAKKIVLATGGKSHPETGSTGEAFEWLRALGHNVREPEASLVPVKIKDDWVKVHSGKSLDKIKLTIYQNEAKQGMRKGKLLFTHFGLSGPTILNMSSTVRELLKYDLVYISIDLLPHLDYSQLNDALQNLFKEDDKKKLKNALGNLVPSFMTPVAIEKSGINGDKACNSVTREERLTLVKVLKDIRVEATGLLGEDKAIITSGGVALEEVDFKTMQSKLFPNLYLVGDILDIDRPSGGYSLQLCWTTGFVAGTHAAEV